MDVVLDHDLWAKRGVIKERDQEQDHQDGGERRSQPDDERRVIAAAIRDDWGGEPLHFVPTNWDNKFILVSTEGRRIRQSPRAHARASDSIIEAFAGVASANNGKLVAVLLDDNRLVAISIVVAVFLNDDLLIGISIVVLFDHNRLVAILLLVTRSDCHANAELFCSGRHCAAYDCCGSNY